MSVESDAGTSARRSRTPWILGLALLAVLAAAVIGVAVGRSTAPGPDILVVPGPVVEQPPVADTLPVGNAAASAAPSAAAPVLSVEGMPVFEPTTILTAASDLPDATGTASGYRVTRNGIDGAALAATLAGAFGVPGEVASDESGWTVGNAESPSLRVNDDVVMSWSFSDPQSPAPAALIDPGRARELAKGLLGAIGVDAGLVDWQVDRYSDGTEVTAWQQVAGARTRLAWRVKLGNDGTVMSASGFAADLEEVADYPVIGAVTAIRRAEVPTWAVIGPTPVTPGDDPAVSPTPLTSAATGRPVLQVPVSQVTITGAELGLTQFLQPNGELLLLPAYRLTGDDGSEWSLIAVTNEYVQFLDQPRVAPTGS